MCPQKTEREPCLQEKGKSQFAVTIWVRELSKFSALPPLRNLESWISFFNQFGQEIIGFSFWDKEWEFTDSLLMRTQLKGGFYDFFFFCLVNSVPSKELASACVQTLLWLWIVETKAITVVGVARELWGWWQISPVQVHIRKAFTQAEKGPSVDT